MGRYEQLSRDFKALDKSISQFLGTCATGTFPTEQHKQLVDEANSRLELLQAAAIDDPSSAQRVNRVALTLRNSVARLRRHEDSQDAAREIHEVIETEVIRLIDEVIVARQKAETEREETAEINGPLTGISIANWRLGGCVGRGGHARVYKAVNVVTGASMCMKTIPFAADSAERREQRERFEREVRVPAEVNHAFLVPIYDAGESSSEEVFRGSLLVLDALHKGRTH